MKDLAGGFGTNQIENVRRNFLPAVRLYFFPPVLLVLYLPSTNKLMNDTILPIALPSIFQSRTPQKNKVRRVVGKRDRHDRNHLSLGGRASVCVDLSIRSGKKFILFLLLLLHLPFIFTCVSTCTTEEERCCMRPVHVDW